jgi:hypothetical protein
VWLWGRMDTDMIGCVTPCYPTSVNKLMVRKQEQTAILCLFLMSEIIDTPFLSHPVDWKWKYVQQTHMKYGGLTLQLLKCLSPTSILVV